MYHEVTYAQIAAQKRRTTRIFVLVCLIIVLLFTGYNLLRYSLREQGAASMRQAIFDAANRCCAVEGSYPSSLDYLEKNYGLVVNTEEYVITYQTYASNVAPTVVVVAR